MRQLMRWLPLVGGLAAAFGAVSAIGTGNTLAAWWAAIAAGYGLAAYWAETELAKRATP
jgi:hypothetical protein